MDEESLPKASTTGSGEEKRDNRERGTSERKRGNWRGRGRGGNNQRGTTRRYNNQHNNRGSGDNVGDQDRPEDGQPQDVGQKQTRSWSSRSNQDQNWRDTSSNSREEYWDLETSSRRRQKRPDREVYSAKGKNWKDGGDSKSDQSRMSQKTNASSSWDGRNRRKENSGSGRGDFKGADYKVDDDWEEEKEDKGANQSRPSKNNYSSSYKSRADNSRTEKYWDAEDDNRSGQNTQSKEIDSSSYKNRGQRGNACRSEQDEFRSESKSNNSKWDNEGDNRFEQSRLPKKGDTSSHEESRQRRTENRSGFRGNFRSNFRGRGGGRGRNQDSYEQNANERAWSSQSRGKRGSRFNSDTRNKTDERIPQSAKNETWGDEEKVTKPKRVIKREKVRSEDASSEKSDNQTESRSNSKEEASNKKKQFVFNADVAPFVPGFRKSPTMGIDPNQSVDKDVYYHDDAKKDNETAYEDVPSVGASAFGVFPDPYGAAYGGEGSGASEVSIGRGASWNEWYHNMWTGTGPMEPNMHARGFATNRSRPGRGQYQNRQSKTRDGPSYAYDAQDFKIKTILVNEQSQSRQFNRSSMAQPGFVERKNSQEKPKTVTKVVKKLKSGKQFSGSSETQTGTLIETLTDGTYECMVCCDVVKCEARVWSCSSCYTVFHLKCIKEWSKSPAAAAEDSDGWKCPACRFVTIHIPYVYKCFCGRTRDPPWEPGDTPHSCGEVCRRKRPSENCSHPCNILCHPGPCPQCPTNVKRSCICGKTKQTVRCGAVPVLRCQKACGKLLNCAVHVCEQICHEDKCDECQFTIEQGCYCGKDKREIVCGSSPDEEEGLEQYSCGQECGRDLECGNHKCKDPCHTGDCDPCPFTPETVKHCPCGQTPLDKLLELEDGKERTECTDPIPTCQKLCGKPLLCGGDNVHNCQKTCHEGECGLCPGTSMVRCRCGHRYIDVPCAELSKGPGEHLCDRKCTKRKSCGKHKCQQKCCVDAGHECLQVCGRKLNCGVHICESQCHLGSCVRCLEASFDELYCHCGASVLMPPIPCGTKPPECTQQCVRRHKCDHPVRHTCHSDEECPPCADLTTKTCMGGHELRHNLPCYIDEVSCGKPCGKPLPCKQHTCQKTCHRGYCGGECSQPCRVPRPDCGHPCNAPCHPDTPCPKQRCKAKVTIKCGCGYLSETAQCLQGVSDTQLTEAFQKMTTSVMASQLKFGQASMDMTKLLAFRDDKGQRVLECTEKCAQIERTRRFADALNINDPDFAGKAPPNYIPFLKEQTKKNPVFVASVEKDFAAVVKAVQSKYTSRSHAFAPMNQTLRRVIHELSDFYGLESQSYDQEPQRNVVVTARRDKCYMPSVTLTAAVQNELHPKAPTPIPPEDLRAASKTTKHGLTILEKKKSVEEEIDYFEMT